MSNIAWEIKSRAVELGYENCGIIKIGDVADFKKRMKERESRIPMGRMQYMKFKNFSSLEADYPWARSIVVTTRTYSDYNVPKGFEGVYGKAYLFDSRLDQNSSGYIQ